MHLATHESPVHVIFFESVNIGRNVVYFIETLFMSILQSLLPTSTSILPVTFRCNCVVFSVISISVGGSVVVVLVEVDVDVVVTGMVVVVVVPPVIVVVVPPGTVVVVLPGCVVVVPPPVPTVIVAHWEI